MLEKSFPWQSFAHHATTPTQVVVRACHGSHHERTTFPENTSFSWNGRLFTQRVTGYCYGSYWSCACCESEPVIGARYSAVVGCACSCVFEPGSDRAHRSSDACDVGETRQFSVKNMMTASCTLIISSKSCHIATLTHVSRSMTRDILGDYY